MKEIRLGTYPYAATRVKVMKTRLIKKDEYYKLMKMHLSEISQFMQQGGYKDEINKLAAKYGGIELLEQAINHNSANTYRKIMRLSSGGLKEVVRIFLGRFDAYNIKTIVRGKFSGASYDEIMASLIPAGNLDIDTLSNLAKKDTVQQAIAALNPSKALKNAVADFERSGDILPIENAADREYYSKICAAADLLPRAGRLLKDFMGTEIDSSDIRMLLRTKKAGISAAEIKKNLHYECFKVSRKTMEELAESKDVSELVAKLEKTYYGKLIASGIKKFREEGTLAVIERDLTKNLLNQANLFLHQNPLSVGPIIGFSIAKEAEARNLKMLAHARYRSMPESFMEEMLVA